MKKAGRLLATQLHQREVTQAVPALSSSTSKLLTRHQDIVEEFAKFYQDLYIPEMSASPAQLDSFLDKAHLPQLTSEGCVLVDGDISKIEIAQAIANLPYHKSTGEDGFPAEFYKFYLLYEAFREASHEGSLAFISNRTVIAVLPKT
ncbi:hypothetical protein NDU88_006590 [Pleurodeles waltl]|uniref:Uncharacterized protein n=1 Tax=Pleurodeles waltl TaxID=8319 RepID=A0AAV7NUV7_PLEWA|nr:hypothetical protein NDU88_006590 [Pleurodeles waltl]